MTLKVEALSEAEGIGIIRSGSALRLVRPPYALRDAPVLSEDSLHDAILHHGFSALAEEFENWGDLIAFLNGRVVAVRRLIGRGIPDAIPAEDLIDVAPPEVLSGFLNRIEEEFIPQRLFDQAERFLLAVLTSKVLTQQLELRSRAARLLRLNSEARKKVDAGISDLASRAVRFPTLEQKQDEYAWSIRVTDIIRERGCVFA